MLSGFFINHKPQRTDLRYKIFDLEFRIHNLEFTI